VSFSTVRELVLFVLAIYAAGLSTWNLLQAIRRDRRRLRVTTGSVIPTFTNGPPGRTWANIAATNLGSRNVTVTVLAFELDDGKRLFTVDNSLLEGMVETTLPHTLSDGETANHLQSYFDIGHALVANGTTGETRITPVCEDSAGGVHRGEPWIIDPMEMVRG
jgi:hypothetical protein